MEETWRWFGPADDVRLAEIRQPGAGGIRTICYNFMPVLDWTRTELDYRRPSGASALRFDAHLYAAFDCFMLARPGAEAEQSQEVLKRAHAWFGAASEDDKNQLLATI